MRPPRRKEQWSDKSKDDNPRARGDSQAGWQEHVGRYFSGVTILDVGAASGASRPRLAQNGSNTVTCQEPAQISGVDTHADIYGFEPSSYDIVTAFDVIEHVSDDWPFLAHLITVARVAVVITTPNYEVSHAQNPAHVREYTPAQLLWMCSRLGHIMEVRAGDPTGDSIGPAMRDVDFQIMDEPHMYVVLSPAVGEVTAG